MPVVTPAVTPTQQVTEIPGSWVVGVAILIVLFAVLVWRSRQDPL